MVKKKVTAAVITPSPIERRILMLRGQRVLLDADLAERYDVETRSLVQALKRNLERFPDDFMFQLTTEEDARLQLLRSQFVISSRAGHGGRRYAPYAFTEQGVAMLSSILRSSRAIAVNIEIMRAFVRLRLAIASNKELSRKLTALETKYDAQFKAVFEAIRQLMTPPVPKRRGIGFVLDDE